MSAERDIGEYWKREAIERLKHFENRAALKSACKRLYSTQPVRQRLLNEYRATLDEHFDAAVDAWQEIRSLEKSIAGRHTVHRTTRDKKPRVRIEVDDRTLASAEHVRMQRAFRFFLNEARAVLEALVYECVTALVPLPIDPVGGSETEHRLLGMYNGPTRKMMLKETRFVALHQHFESIAGGSEPKMTGCAEYERLNDLRATSFHRRVLYPRRGMTWIDVGEDSHPSVYFLLPQDAK